MLDSESKPKKTGRPKKQVSELNAAAKANLLKQASITKEALQAEKCKRSFYHFFTEAFKILEPKTVFVGSEILKEVCDTLQAEAERIARGEKKNADIIINIPPRTSKSLICSICFPAWVWTKYPHMRFICASYADKLSTKLSTDCRTLIQSDWYKKLFPEVKLADDANNKTSFETTARGARIATSVGGTVTGMGADIIIIDDAQKPDEATSEIATQTVKDWYDNTIENRLNDATVGIRIIVMQRLSEDDLSGYLLSEYPESFNHICIPVELDIDTEVKPAHFRDYYQDGLFCPIRFPVERLNDLKKKPYKYAGQYLQKPAPVGGGLFKRDSFQRITKAEFLSKFRDKRVVWNFFIDTAYTDNKKNDASAILVGAVMDNQLYVIDVKTKHLMFPDLLKFLKEYIPQFYSAGSRIYIEAKASGLSLIQQLRKDTTYPIIDLHTGKDSKYVRAESISDFVDSKRVTLIEGGYVDSFLEQITIFPNAKNDDMVDALVYAVKTLVTQKKSFSYRKI